MDYVTARAELRKMESALAMLANNIGVSNSAEYDAAIKAACVLQSFRESVLPRP